MSLKDEFKKITDHSVNNTYSEVVEEFMTEFKTNAYSKARAGIYKWQIPYKYITDPASFDFIKQRIIDEGFTIIFGKGYEGLYPDSYYIGWN
jgi:hypothetical protein